MTNPILLDIPESFETERLLIRVPRPGELRGHHVGIDGTLRNKMVFALTDEDWRKLPRAANPPLAEGLPT
ncbi:MAG: hypothetical protein ABSD28_08290 [Tepidisphaeraceae bacterium]|jgi:hypothetical protein